MPNSIPKKPWIHILADFITKLPLAQGYDSILVVVNRLTKMLHFYYRENIGRRISMVV